MTQQWKPIESAPKDELILVGPTKRMGICVAMNHSRDGWVTETCNEWFNIYTPTHWMPLPAAPGTPPASAQPERDWELSCDHCDGDGFVYVERRVGPCATDIQTFKEECECCEGRGFTIAFEDIPGIAEYVRKSRPVASAQDDAKDERQAFEAWGMAGCEMVDDPQSGRFDIARHCAWEAWKARASLAAPAAGDARDVARYREVRNNAWVAGTEFRIMNPKLGYVAPRADVEFDAFIDAAIAAKHKGDA
ncbi:DUF551 domain-containing protein [Achromobacter sp. MFA1 R4]|uniref:DUF551 domain-containing protein n=1 Tax=Achromobacter sp. MFA1 R4 TaxID=1881016 RepID=UPI00095384EE|nr:DUF551 domain-containing protein [Achromobacter sp. MFA1 R4]SIS99981.1 Protein of unknown function [Achromobacter sp. MFA1 R4]SIT27905.1 Protein of unknown function [Achromobacter sp. MFA1 R4]